MLRVISGKYRGRKLKQPSLTITRPTMDRVKEAIFSSIQFKVEGSVVLDLFAGSGSLSIESLSRGAIKSIAIDKSEEAIKIMKENIASLEITNMDVVKSDVINFVSGASGKKFDFIFMDPPFKDFEIYNKTFNAILESNILKKEGLIILETSNVDKIIIPKGFTIHRQKKYGISHVLMIANNI